MPKKRIYINVILFVATFLSTSIAGVQWANKDFTDVLNWKYGLEYAILIMTFLSAHEFGHYIASRIHKVDATLPYYIPMPFPFMINFGTFGAVIKTRSPIMTRKALFDIGVAGPVSGFIVCLGFIIYGLMTMPPIDFIYKIHPQYLTLYHGVIPTTSLHFGDTLLYAMLAKVFANPHGFLPPMNEIYHYPFLNVGWFGLFVTSLNMLPIGQLDGGHVTYAMFGEKVQHLIARIVWWSLIVLGCASLLGLLYEQLQSDYPNRFYIMLQSGLMPMLSSIKSNVPWLYYCWGGWILWAFITKIFIKLDHPTIYDDEELSQGRKLIGWIALAIFILSFSYNGIYII